MTDDRRPDPSAEEPEVFDAERPSSEVRITDRRVAAEPAPPESEAETVALDREDVGGGTERLEHELEEATRVAEERLDQMRRLKADFENYRKRVIREQTDVVERASLRVVEKVLPVLDDFERALDAARKEGAEGIVRGLELVYRHLRDVLETEGLERVEAQGASFDPQHHEAVASVPGDVDEPTVLEVVRPGYRMKGRTIRPALVHVSTPAETEAAEDE